MQDLRVGADCVVPTLFSLLVGCCANRIDDMLERFCVLAWCVCERPYEVTSIESAVADCDFIN